MNGRSDEQAADLISMINTAPLVLHVGVHSPVKDVWLPTRLANAIVVTGPAVNGADSHATRV
jgi:hypothetical protein